MAPREKTKKGQCRSIRQLLILTRARRGWKQSQSAKALETTLTTYKNWERGQKPQVEKFDRIAKHCGVDVLSLVLMATAEDA